MGRSPDHVREAESTESAEIREKTFQVCSNLNRISFRQTKQKKKNRKASERQKA